MKFKLTIYLAGGMRGDWQDRLITECGFAFNYMDPRENRKFTLMSSPEYVFWDTNRMDRSDMFFLYLEASNPGGYASMVEAGYMIGQGKSGIFVNEQHENRYTTFLSDMPRVLTYTNFEEAVAYLATLE